MFGRAEGPTAHTVTTQPGGAPSPTGASPSQPLGAPFGAPIPQGLQQLAAVDALCVKQNVTDVSIFNARNCFGVFSGSGAPLYSIEETTGGLMRNLAGSNRFSLAMKDLNGYEVLKMERRFQLTEARVHVTCQGSPLGSSVFARGFCSPEYDICGPDGNAVLRARAQSKTCFVGCGGTAEFLLLTPDGQQIGRIAKEWGGFGREFFTSADTFGVTFPADLHVSMKAVVLATTILIDFLHFEGR